MKNKLQVAINLNSTQSGHKDRGIGFYTSRLYEHMGKICDKFDVTLLPYTQEQPQADIFHFPAFTPFFFSFNPLLIKKSIITIHDLIPLEFPKAYPPGIKGNLKWQMQRFLLPQAKIIITDSNASKLSIQKLIPAVKNNIKVIYLAADPIFKPIVNKKILAAIKQKYCLPGKFIIYVGDVNYNKNVMMLVQVCIDLKLPLVIIGKQAVTLGIDQNHPENRELVKLQTIALQNPQIIKRLGFVPTEDLVGLYNLATCLVHPALAEGFGFPVLEAMQCGCPVICSNTSSLPEIAGRAALLFSPSDKEALQASIKKVWSDSNLRKKMQVKGQKQAREFSWEITAELTLKTYRQAYEH